MIGQIVVAKKLRDYCRNNNADVLLLSGPSSTGYKRRFWKHVSVSTNKSEELYSRMREMMSANWGLGHRAVATIYITIFVPRCAYAARIWEGVEQPKRQ